MLDNKLDHLLVILVLAVFVLALLTGYWPVSLAIAVGVGIYLFFFGVKGGLK